MKITISIDVTTERDRDGETADDEQRMADLAHAELSRCVAGLSESARAEGIQVDVQAR